MSRYDDASYTVDLWLSVPVPLRDGGWAWGVHPSFPDAVAREFVYTCREMYKVIRTYGRYLADMIKARESESFTVTATACPTGWLLARDQWLWTPAAGKFLPHGEPLCVWEDAERRYRAEHGAAGHPGTIRPVLAA